MTHAVDAPTVTRHIASTSTAPEPVDAVVQRVEVGTEQFSPLWLAGGTGNQNAVPLMTAPSPVPEEHPTAPRLLTNVTGPGINNTASQFGIGSTDLGIMWDNGIRGDYPATTVVEQRQVLIAFGDTFSSATAVRSGDWTINTLLRSADSMLSNGMYVKDGVQGDIFSGSAMKPARVPAVASPGYAIGPEVTIIPTSGISAPYPMLSEGRVST